MKCSADLTKKSGCPIVKILSKLRHGCKLAVPKCVEAELSRSAMRYFHYIIAGRKPEDSVEISRSVGAALKQSNDA